MRESCVESVKGKVKVAALSAAFAMHFTGVAILAHAVCAREHKEVL